MNIRIDGFQSNCALLSKGCWAVVHDAGIVVTKAKCGCLTRTHSTECTFKSTLDVVVINSDITVSVFSSVFMVES